jgi:hypothetical protein
MTLMWSFIVLTVGNVVIQSEGPIRQLIGWRRTVSCKTLIDVGLMLSPICFIIIIILYCAHRNILWLFKAFCRCRIQYPRVCRYVS